MINELDKRQAQNAEGLRTPEIIAAEIRYIDQKAKAVVLESCIEIGRRLIEAKALVSHGEWGKWLEENVNYSQSTANNFMGICKKFGSEQTNLFLSSSQAFENLTYTKAVAMLGVPMEDIEEFLESKPVEQMSTREFQDEIEQLKKRLGEKEQEIDKSIEERQKYQTRCQEEINRAAGFEKKLKAQLEAAEKAKQDAEALKEKHKKSRQRVEELETQIAQLENRPAEPDQQVLSQLQSDAQKAAEERLQAQIQKLEEEKQRAEEKARQEAEKAARLEKQMEMTGDNELLQFNSHFQEVQKEFNTLFKLLDQIVQKSPEKAGKLREAIQKVVSVVDQTIKQA